MLGWLWSSASAPPSLPALRDATDAPGATDASMVVVDLPTTHDAAPRDAQDEQQNLPQEVPRELPQEVPQTCPAQPPSPVVRGVAGEPPATHIAADLAALDISNSPVAAPFDEANVLCLPTRPLLQRGASRAERIADFTQWLWCVRGKQQRVPSAVLACIASFFDHNQHILEPCDVRLELEQSAPFYAAYAMDATEIWLRVGLLAGQPVTPPSINDDQAARLVSLFAALQGPWDVIGDEWPLDTPFLDYNFCVRQFARKCDGLRDFFFPLMGDDTFRAHALFYKRLLVQAEVDMARLLAHAPACVPEIHLLDERDNPMTRLAAFRTWLRCAQGKSTSVPDDVVAEVHAHLRKFVPELPAPGAKWTPLDVRNAIANDFRGDAPEIWTRITREVGVRFTQLEEDTLCEEFARLQVHWPKYRPQWGLDTPFLEHGYVLRRLCVTAWPRVEQLRWQIPPPPDMYVRSHDLAYEALARYNAAECADVSAGGTIAASAMPKADAVKVERPKTPPDDSCWAAHLAPRLHVHASEDDRIADFSLWLRCVRGLTRRVPPDVLNAVGARLKMQAPCSVTLAHVRALIEEIAPAYAVDAPEMWLQLCGGAPLTMSDAQHTHVCMMFATMQRAWPKYARDWPYPTPFLDYNFCVLEFLKIRFTWPRQWAQHLAPLRGDPDAPHAGLAPPTPEEVHEYQTHVRVGTLLAADAEAMLSARLGIVVRWDTFSPTSHPRDLPGPADFEHWLECSQGKRRRVPQGTVDFVREHLLMHLADRPQSMWTPALVRDVLLETCGADHAVDAPEIWHRLTGAPAPTFSHHETAGLLAAYAHLRQAWPFYASFWPVGLPHLDFAHIVRRVLDARLGWAQWPGHFPGPPAQEAAVHARFYEALALDTLLGTRFVDARNFIGTSQQQREQVAAARQDAQAAAERRHRDVATPQDLFDRHVTAFRQWLKRLRVPVRGPVRRFAGWDPSVFDGELSVNPFLPQQGAGFVARFEALRAPWARHGWRRETFLDFEYVAEMFCRLDGIPLVACDEPVSWTSGATWPVDLEQAAILHAMFADLEWRLPKLEIHENPASAPRNAASPATQTQDDRAHCEETLVAPETRADPALRAALFRAWLMTLRVPQAHVAGALERASFAEHGIAKDVLPYVTGRRADDVHPYTCEQYAAFQRRFETLEPLWQKHARGAAFPQSALLLEQFCGLEGVAMPPRLRDWAMSLDQFHALQRVYAELGWDQARLRHLLQWQGIPRRETRDAEAQAEAQAEAPDHQGCAPRECACAAAAAADVMPEPALAPIVDDSPARAYMSLFASAPVARDPPLPGGSADDVALTQTLLDIKAQKQRIDGLMHSALHDPPGANNRHLCERDACPLGAARTAAKRTYEGLPQPRVLAVLLGRTRPWPNTGDAAYDFTAERVQRCLSDAAYAFDADDDLKSELRHRCANMFAFTACTLNEISLKGMTELICTYSAAPDAQRDMQCLALWLVQEMDRLARLDARATMAAAHLVRGAGPALLEDKLSLVDDEAFTLPTLSSMLIDAERPDELALDLVAIEARLRRDVALALFAAADCLLLGAEQVDEPRVVYGLDSFAHPLESSYLIHSTYILTQNINEALQDARADGVCGQILRDAQCLLRGLLEEGLAQFAGRTLVLPARAFL